MLTERVDVMPPVAGVSDESDGDADPRESVPDVLVFAESSGFD